MLQMGVALVLLCPGPARMACLTVVDLITFMGNAVHARGLQPQVVLHRLQEGIIHVQFMPQILILVSFVTVA
jgi:hypothetical protein